MNAVSVPVHVYNFMCIKRSAVLKEFHHSEYLQSQLHIFAATLQLTGGGGELIAAVNRHTPQLLVKWH